MLVLFIMWFCSFALAQEDPRNVAINDVGEVTLDHTWERADQAYRKAQQALQRANRNPNKAALEELKAAQAGLQTALDALPAQIEASKQEALETVKATLEALAGDLDTKFTEIDRRLNVVENDVIVLRGDMSRKSGCSALAGLFLGVDFHAPIEPAIDGVAWFTPGLAGGMACEAQRWGTTLEGNVSLLVPGSFNAGASIAQYWHLSRITSVGVALGGSYSGLGLHDRGYAGQAFNLHVGPYGRFAVVDGLDVVVRPQARFAWPSLYYGERGFSIAAQLTAGVQYRF